MQDVGHAASRDADPDDTAARPAQQLRNVAAFDPDDIAAVDLHDAVIGLHADTLGRALDYGVDDDDRVVHYVVLDAYAAELAVERLALGLHLLLVEIYGVGIQILEHAAYGILHQRLHIDLIDIRSIEIAVETVEFLQLLERLGGRLLLLCRYAAVDRKRKE